MVGPNLNLLDLGENMKECNIFDKLYSELYPEMPPNYPLPFLWENVDGMSPENIIKKWLDSNIKHNDKKHVIYIHFPFCLFICDFCGFYKKKLNSSLEIDYYLSKLSKEMSFFKDSFINTKIRWLCLGGGTPSVLNEKQIDLLFNEIDKNFNLSGTKVAFEALPQTLTQSKLKNLKEKNVYFLALGVQSFNEELMKSLNRFQSKRQIIDVINKAKRAGIKNIEVDLMIGLPGQTEEIFLEDIKIVADMDIERVYMFDFQPRYFTKQKKIKSSLSMEELEKWRYIRSKGIDILIKNGYKMRCGRWLYKREGEAWPYSYDQQEDGGYSIIGLGPGSISYCMDGMRYRNIPNLKKYYNYLDSKLLPIDKIKFLSIKDEMKNMFIIKIIHTGKIYFSDFRERFKKDIRDIFKNELEILERDNLICFDKNGIVSLNRSKLQDVLNIIFYPISVIKENKMVNSLMNDINKKDKWQGVNNSKIIDLSGDVKKNLVDIYNKKKLGLSELFFLAFKRISLKKMNFYIGFVHKNNFIFNFITKYENLLYYSTSSLYNKFNKKYVFIDDHSLLKSIKDIDGVVIDFATNIADIPNYLENINSNNFVDIIFCFNFLSKNKNNVIDYQKLKKVIPYIIKVMKTKKIKVFLSEIPYCILYPHLNLFYTFNFYKSGDNRESNYNIIKLPQCLDCKYLLKCPGPNRYSIETFGDFLIKPII